MAKIVPLEVYPQGEESQKVPSEIDRWLDIDPAQLDAIDALHASDANLNGALTILTRSLNAAGVSVQRGGTDVPDNELETVHGWAPVVSECITDLVLRGYSIVCIGATKNVARIPPRMLKVQVNVRIDQTMIWRAVMPYTRKDLEKSATTTPGFGRMTELQRLERSRFFVCVYKAPTVDRGKTVASVSTSVLAVSGPSMAARIMRHAVVMTGAMNVIPTGVTTYTDPANAAAKTQSALSIHDVLNANDAGSHAAEENSVRHRLDVATAHVGLLKALAAYDEARATLTATERELNDDVDRKTGMYSFPGAKIRIGAPPIKTLPLPPGMQMTSMPQATPPHEAMRLTSSNAVAAVAQMTGVPSALFDGDADASIEVSQARWDLFYATLTHYTEASERLYTLFYRVVFAEEIGRDIAPELMRIAFLDKEEDGQTPYEQVGGTDVSGLLRSTTTKEGETMVRGDPGEDEDEEDEDEEDETVSRLTPQQWKELLELKVEITHNALVEPTLILELFDRGLIKHECVRRALIRFYHFTEADIPEEPLNPGTQRPIEEEEEEKRQDHKEEVKLNVKAKTEVAKAALEKRTTSSAQNVGGQASKKMGSTKRKSSGSESSAKKAKK